MTTFMFKRHLSDYQEKWECMAGNNKSDVTKEGFLDNKGEGFLDNKSEGGKEGFLDNSANKPKMI